jgi:hypothetical protein
MISDLNKGTITEICQTAIQLSGDILQEETTCWTEEIFRCVT